MCGLFGFVGSAPNLETLKEVAVLAGTRGVHGWGIEYDTGNQRGTGKLENNLGVLEHTKHSSWVLGHSRLATFGSYEGVIQPIKSENFLIAHNGNIYNYQEIANQIGYTMKTDCDSEIIGALLEKGYRPKQISDMIQTNHAILIRTKYSLYAIHRGLPLFYVQKEEGIYYCSRKMNGGSALTEGVEYV